ncbi:hypothetical protein AMTR_s05445p00005520, partial [Amborella trichopoda]
MDDSHYYFWMKQQASSADWAALVLRLCRPRSLPLLVATNNRYDYWQLLVYAYAESNAVTTGTQ